MEILAVNCLPIVLEHINRFVQYLCDFRQRVVRLQYGQCFRQKVQRPISYQFTENQLIFRLLCFVYFVKWIALTMDTVRRAHFAALDFVEFGLYSDRRKCCAPTQKHFYWEYLCILN